MANNLWASMFGFGLAAKRPSSPDFTNRVGIFYYATDTGVLSAFVDPGTGTRAWTNINSGILPLTATTVAALPATPVAGQIALVNDATTPAVGTAVTGGSNKLALVAWSGSAWIVV